MTVKSLKQVSASTIVPFTMFLEHVTLSSTNMIGLENAGFHA